MNWALNGVPATQMVNTYLASVHLHPDINSVVIHNNLYGLLTTGSRGTIWKLPSAGPVVPLPISDPAISGTSYNDMMRGAMYVANLNPNIRTCVVFISDGTEFYSD